MSTTNLGGEDRGPDQEVDRDTRLGNLLGSGSIGDFAAALGELNVSDIGWMFDQAKRYVDWNAHTWQSFSLGEAYMAGQVAWMQERMSVIAEHLTERLAPYSVAAAVRCASLLYATCVISSWRLPLTRAKCTTRS